MHLFDEATLAVAADDAVESPTRTWEADLPRSMSIVDDHVHGGFMLALLGRTGVAAVGQDEREVVSASATYVKAPVVGRATIETEVLRRGRTASQVRTRLVQDRATCVEALLTVGTLTDAPPQWGEVPPPEMPSFADCREAMRAATPGPGWDGPPPMAQTVTMAFDPATAGFAAGRPSGAGELRAWIEMAGGRAPDPLALLFAVDVLPPATFDVAITGWVPTLSLTAYVRALPAPGPLRLRMRAGPIADGFVDETCEVWDSTDRLVAIATQLAAIRMG